MTRYTSGDKLNLKIGIESYSENLTSLEVIGTAEIDGDINVSAGNSITAPEYYGDGSNLTGLSAGQVGAITDLVSDTSPELGGDLDLNGFDIIETGNINITGVITATSFSGDLTGTATTATKLETSRNFSVSGDVATTSAVSFDGTANVDLAVTLSNNFSANTSGIITAFKFSGGDINVSAGNSITAPKYYGDGSNLTGLSAGQVGALAGVTIREEGTLEGSAGSVGDINFVSSNLTATASGIGATITLTDTPSFTTISGDLTGTASTATKLETSRNFSVSGDVATASNVSFDGTADVDLAVTLSNDFSANTSGIITAFKFSGGDINVSAGNSITAPKYYGDGSNLTNLTPGQVGALAGVTIREEGTLEGSAGSVGDINFVGNYMTATASGAGATITLSDITLGTDTIGNYVATISGTANEIEVTNGSSAGSNPTIGLPNNVTISNDLSVSGNLNVTGTLTYEDVTNVDSIGIVTARSGIDAEGDINVSAGNSITAPKYYGDGSGLTGLSAGQVGAMTDLVSDTSPELGGDLDLNNFDITGNGNINITGVITATSFVGTASTATTVTISSNNDSTAYRVPYTSSTSGNVSLYVDNSDGMTYNPGTNTLFAGSFSGNGSNLTGLSATQVGAMAELVSDTSPQLGGDLDLNGFDITETGNINITGVVTATSFDGSLATSNLTGTITNSQLEGSIANSKLSNSTVSYGGVQLSLGGSDPTPAFDLSDATNYPYSSLVGTPSIPSATSDLTNDSGFITSSDDITGNAATATTASNVSVTGSGNANATRYLFMSNATSGSSPTIVDSQLSYNPATNVLTAGGFSGDGSALTNISAGQVSGAMSSLVNDTTPQLGGDLDLNGFDITGTGNVNISGIITATSFDGSLATSNLTGTITNSQLAGSIANSKLSNSTVSYGGVQLSLGGSDPTPAFDLSDATNYPTSSLSGTITNAQLAGSIANSKLSNSTVSYGGVQLSLGGSDSTPAFDLSDATNYPYSSLVGSPSIPSATSDLTNDSGFITSSDDITGNAATATTATNANNIEVDVNSNTGYRNIVTVNGTDGNLKPQVNTSIQAQLSSGTIKATIFSGSGASLTNLPAGQLTGTISDARLPNSISSDITGNAASADTVDVTLTGTNTSYNVLFATGGSNQTVRYDGGITYNPNSNLFTVTNGTIQAGGTSTFSGNGSNLTNIPYSSLTGTPTIPSATSDLTNDSGFITSVSFDNLTGKTSGTGEYSTSGNLVSGRGSGGVALTINDGYGNANVTFNHKNGTPEQNGKAGRIEVNTDSTSGNASMSFELGSATANTAAGITQLFVLSDGGSSFTSNAGLTFSNRPAFNGGTSGSTSPFTVDSTQVVTNLNADLLDGQQGSYYLDYTNFTGTPSIPSATSDLTNDSGFITDITTQTDPKYLRSDAGDTATGALEFSGGLALTNGPGTIAGAFFANGWLRIGSSTLGYAFDNNELVTFGACVVNSASGSTMTFNNRPAFNGGTSGSTSPFTVDSTQVVTNLNADTVDGIQGASFLRSDVHDASAPQRIEFKGCNTNNYDTIATATGSQGSIEVFNNGSGNDAFMAFHTGSDYALYFGLDADSNSLAVGGWSMGANKYKIWHAGNDGSGSGLDADTVDGIQGSALAPIASPTFTGNVTIPNALVHDGDTNTYIQFHGNDLFRVVISGAEVQEWGNNYTLLSDNDQLRLGSGSDFRMFFNGADTFFRNYAHADGDIIFQGENSAGTNQNLLIMKTDGTRTYNILYENSQERLRTTSGGVTVTGNITVTGTVDGRDIATDGSKLDGIESGATGDQTASEILTAIKTVDGSGSGLDADTLDGLQTSSSGDRWNVVPYVAAGGVMEIGRYIDFHATDGSSIDYTNRLDAGTSGNITLNGYKIWHAGNDGAGSGLDADTVDGVQGSSFLRSDASDTTSGNLTVEGVIFTNEIRDRTGSQLVLNAGEAEGKFSGQTGEYVYVNAESGLYVSTPDRSHPNFQSGYTQDSTIIRGEAITVNGNTVWHAGNDGSGSGLDADTLDGLQGTKVYEASSTIQSNLDTYYTSSVFSYSNTTTGRPSSYGMGLAFVSSAKTYNTTNNWITQLAFSTTGGEGPYFRTRVNAGSWGGWTEIWNAANDGAGSGLDADLLDGQQGSYYLNYNNLTNTPTAGISAAEGQRKAILAAKIFGRF